MEEEVTQNTASRSHGARWLARVAAAWACAWLASCGGGDSGTTPATPVATPTPAPVRSVVAQGNFSVSAPDDHSTYFVRRRLETTKAGTLEVTVDWTYASNTLWMYLAEGECTSDQFASNDCPGPACACKFAVESEVESPKPRVLAVASAAAGVRTLVVWNLGPREDACSHQAVLTSAAAGASARPVIGEAGAVEGRKQRPRQTPSRTVPASAS